MRRHYGQHSDECGRCQDERDEYGKPEYRDDYDQVMAEIEREMDAASGGAELGAYGTAASSTGIFHRMPLDRGRARRYLGCMQETQTTISLGALVAKSRAALGVSQRAIAAASGVSHVFVGDIERGTRTASDETLTALATALHIEPSILLAIADRERIARLQAQIVAIRCRATDTNRLRILSTSDLDYKEKRP